ncbi:transposon Tf2-1 polyprotein, partial [Tanacetum coccineum]
SIKMVVGGLSALSGPSEVDISAEGRGSKRLITEVTNDPQSRTGFSLVNGKLYHKERLVIPATSPWISQLLEEFHSSPNGGHSGFYRTYRRLASIIYWLGITKSVREFFRACDTCQRYKSSTLSPVGLLQPLPIPDSIWEDISIGFITGLPKSKGYEVILVVVDRLSKYCHFIPLKCPFTARSLAKVFLKEVIRLHGIPKSVLSDRDPLFLSTFWKEIFSLRGSKLKFSSAYHLGTDGHTEVVNWSLETYLHCFAAEQPKNWSFWLPWAEFWHNTSFHVSTNTTPFKVVYGRAPPIILKYVTGEIHCEAVASDLQDRDEALK